MIGLLDLDPLIYAAGFVTQHKRWQVLSGDGQLCVDFRCKQVKPQHYKVIDASNATIHEGKTLREVKAHMEIRYPEEEGYEWKEYLHVEPVENAIFTLRAMVNGYFKDAQVTQRRIFLDGDRNFRHDVATIQGYKANRKDNPKPEHYAALRDYAVKHLGAIVCSDIETDDALSMEQHQAPENTIIITIDKDLLMVPGYKFYYNRAKELPGGKKDVTPCFLYQTKDLALRSFYQQLIVGDRTDNIPGLGGTREEPGIGDKGAEKIVAGFTDFRALQAHIVGLYREKYGESYTYLNVRGEEQTKTCEQLVEEVGQLVWMRRWANDWWNLRTVEEFTDPDGRINESSIYF